MGNSRTHIEKFDNLEAFLNHVASTPEHWRRDSKASKSFSGSRDIDHAFEIARHGFESDSIQVELDKVREISNSSILDMVDSVSGAVVNIGAFLEGVPENMIDFPLNDNLKFVDIIFDCCENVGVDEEYLRNKAVATACLVDHLENNGYRVGLYVAALMDEDAKDENFYILTNVKRHQEPLSIGQLTGVMHPAFLRRLVFLAIEKRYSGRPQPGYGRAMKHKTNCEIALQALEAPNAIFIPSTSAAESFGCFSGIRTQEAAKQYVEFFATKVVLEDGKLAI